MQSLIQQHKASGNKFIKNIFLMVNNNLVYLSYGNQIEYRRAIFSILSFFSWCGDLESSTRIIVYTDAPEFFQAFFGDREIEYYYLSPGLLSQMKGPDLFIHRVKVNVIKLTFENYPGENQIFIDSDTFFTADASALFKGINSGKSLMHVREYALKDSIQMFSSFNQGHFPKAFMKLITNHTFEVGAEPISFNDSDYSWNSGVIGLHSTFASSMPDVLNLTDRFYAGSKWFISEQLAFGLILQRKTEITAADNYIFHYWGKRQKILLDKLLAGYAGIADNTLAKHKDAIKTKTRSYMKAVKNDLILEQIEIAIDFKSWVYAFKKTGQFILINPFNLKLYSDLFSTLKSKSQLL